MFDVFYFQFCGREDFCSSTAFMVILTDIQTYAAIRQRRNACLERNGTVIGESATIATKGRTRVQRRLDVCLFRL